MANVYWNGSNSINSDDAANWEQFDGTPLAEPPLLVLGRLLRRKDALHHPAREDVGDVRVRRRVAAEAPQVVGRIVERIPRGDAGVGAGLGGEPAVADADAIVAIHM